jgi:type IV pilus assembly protein PilB
MNALDGLSASNRKLVEHARKSGVADAQLIAAAENFASRHGGKALSEILVELGYVTERQIAPWLATIHGLEQASEVDLRAALPEVVRIIDQGVARARAAIAIRKGLGKSSITVAIADPDTPQFNQVRYSLQGYAEVKYVIAPRLDIIAALDVAYANRAASVGDDEKSWDQIIEATLAEAVIQRASDIHINPEENSVEVRFRIDGRLRTYQVFDGANKARLITAWKLATGRADDGKTKLPADSNGGDLHVDKTTIIQDGNATRKFGSRRFALRFSDMPTINGESIVVRLLDLDAKVGSLADLGMLPDQEQLYIKSVKLSDGLIINCGPTGHGKSTTLAAGIQYMDPDREKSIDTVENPVEYRFPGVRQHQVVPGVPGKSFADNLKGLLRHNPNIIIVGEMRDPETARIGVEASNTGHLVASTLHANSSLGAVPRLIELGVEPAVLALSSRLYIAQRLVAKLCPHCSKIHPRARELADEHGALWRRAAGLGVVSGEPNFREAGTGCPKCSGGVKGRLAIYEMREATDFLKARIAAEGREFNTLAADRDYALWTEENSDKIRPVFEEIGFCRDRVEAAKNDPEQHAVETQRLSELGLRYQAARAEHAHRVFTARTLREDGILKAALGWATVEEVFARISVSI